MADTPDLDAPKAATVEELERRCGHECLSAPDHEGPHFYGYRVGPHSYEGVKAERDALRAEVDRLVEGIRSLVVWAGVQNRIDPRKAVEMLEALLDTSDDQPAMRTLRKGDELRSVACHVTVTEHPNGPTVWAHCASHLTEHLIDASQYQAGLGPWRPVDTSDDRQGTTP